MNPDSMQLNPDRQVPRKMNFNGTALNGYPPSLRQTDSMQI